MKLKLLTISIIAILGFVCWSLFVPTNNFPTKQTFKIESGQSEEVVLNNLKSNGYLRDVNLAKLVGRALPGSIQLGSYSFEHKLSLWQLMVALRLPPKTVKVTIPEGFTKVQVGERLEKNLGENFNKQSFLNNIEEGYIFPETYYFPVFVTTDEILQEFKDERSKRLKVLEEKFGRLPTRDEIILASILEREARGLEDMKLVAGILDNRLEVGMPLQVDATILYAKGWKEKVTFRDLEHDSEYNTYGNKGLPPTAISNPSIIALEAAMNPTNTKYMYYLTGSDGTMHYSKTFEQHVQNRKYLD